jgi:ribosomal protein L2
VLSNPQHKNRKLGKAGAARWSGRKPTVRCSNLVDCMRPLRWCFAVCQTDGRQGMRPLQLAALGHSCVKAEELKESVVWQTRGVAMNPVDHPHGGGRGKQKGRISQTPWGKPTKGYKTRQRRSPTSKFIHLSRHDAARAGRG